jgi:anti-anti-sigma regulatory factor
MDQRRDHHPRLPFALHVIRGVSSAQVMAIGEVRQQEVELLRRCLRALVERGATRVVVEMRDVSFVSPAGRRALATIADDVPTAEVFLAGLGGSAHRAIAQRHARTRIRVPRVWCRRCEPTARIVLPRRS